MVYYIEYNVLSTRCLLEHLKQHNVTILSAYIMGIWNEWPQCHKLTSHCETI